LPAWRASRRRASLCRVQKRAYASRWSLVAWLRPPVRAISSRTAGVSESLIRTALPPARAWRIRREPLISASYPGGQIRRESLKLFWSRWSLICRPSCFKAERIGPATWTGSARTTCLIFIEPFSFRCAGYFKFMAERQ